MKNNAPFIYASDEKTIKELTRLGFQIYSQNDNTVTFLNNNKISFDVNELKLIYSNKLCI